MKTKEYRCKYCGAKSSNLCSNCKEKLELIRIILQMVRNKAKEVGYFDTHKK